MEMDKYESRCRYECQLCDFHINYKIKKGRKKNYRSLTKCTVSE